MLGNTIWYVPHNWWETTATIDWYQGVNQKNGGRLLENLIIRDKIPNLENIAIKERNQRIVKMIEMGFE